MGGRRKGERGFVIGSKRSEEFKKERKEHGLLRQRGAAHPTTKLGVVHQVYRDSIHACGTQGPSQRGALRERIAAMWESRSGAGNGEDAKVVLSWSPF